MPTTTTTPDTTVQPLGRHITSKRHFTKSSPKRWIAQCRNKGLLIRIHWLFYIRPTLHYLEVLLVAYSESQWTVVLGYLAILTSNFVKTSQVTLIMAGVPDP